MCLRAEAAAPGPKPAGSLPKKRWLCPSRPVGIVTGRPRQRRRGPARTPPGPPVGGGRGTTMKRMPTVSLLDSRTPVPGSDDDVLRLIGPTGERTPNTDLDPWVSDVDDDALVRLLTDMAVVRRVDLEATALAPRPGGGPRRRGSPGGRPDLAPARALREDDFIFPSYRETGVAYCRGVDMLEVLRLWRGAALCGWTMQRMGTAQIVIGAQALHAAGYALGPSPTAGCRHHHLLRRRRHQPGPRQPRGLRSRRQPPARRCFARTTTWSFPNRLVQAHAPLAGRAAGSASPP